jgi:hypothetical protein
MTLLGTQIRLTQILNPSLSNVQRTRELPRHDDDWDPDELNFIQIGRARAAAHTDNFRSFSP